MVRHQYAGPRVAARTQEEDAREGFFHYPHSHFTSVGDRTPRNPEVSIIGHYRTPTQHEAYPTTIRKKNIPSGIPHPAPSHDTGHRQHGVSAGVGSGRDFSQRDPRTAVRCRRAERTVDVPADAC